MLILAAIIFFALVAGYITGRVRPLDRLDTWVWRRLTFGGKWTRSKPQQVLTLAVHVVVRPVATVRIWRHRNDPPVGRSAPVGVPQRDPEWMNKRHTSDPEVP